MAFVTNGANAGNRKSGLKHPAALVVGSMVVALAATAPAVVSLERVWRAMNDYRYGYLVAVLVAVWVGKRVAGLRGHELKPSVSAIALLLGTLLLWLIAYNGCSVLGQQLLLPAILWLTVCSVAGWTSARLLLAPLAFLYFAIPLWEVFVPWLQRLTVIVTESSMRLGGVPTTVVGTRVSIPEGTFTIAEGCSGRNYFVATLTFASLAAAAMRLNAWRAAVLIATATGLALVANWTRVLTVVIAGHLTDMQHRFITEEHLLLGDAIFVVLLALVIVLARRLSKGAPAVANVSPREPVTGSGVAAQRGRPEWAGAVVAVALLVAAGGTTRLASGGDSPAPQLLPLPLVVGTWRGPMPPSPAWSPHFEGAADARRAAYFSDSAQVQIYVNLYGRQRQGRELVFYRNSVLGPGDWDEVASRARWASGMAAFSGTPTVVTASDEDGHLWVVAYLYVVGDFSSGDEAVTQILYGIGATIGNPASGLVAAAVRCEDASCAAAQREVDAFWTQMSPTLLGMLGSRQARRDSRSCTRTETCG